MPAITKAAWLHGRNGIQNRTSFYIVYGLYLTTKTRHRAITLILQKAGILLVLHDLEHARLFYSMDR
jgi:hypothetical protein